MNNIITCFFSYKISRFCEYGSLFYLDDDLDFVKKCLSTYFKTYIDCYYYHKLDTLDNSNLYDMEDVLKELDGKRLELLQEFEDRELMVSNDYYRRGREIINEIPSLIPYLIEIDKLEVKENDNISDLITHYCNCHDTFKEKIGKNVFKLISYVRDTYYVVNKFFKEEESFFSIDYSKSLNSIYYLGLKHSIKVLDTNYKNTLVEKIYKDYKLDIKKCSVLINKLDKELLLKEINDDKLDKYIITITEEMFERGKFVLYEYFNNPIIKRCVILNVSLNLFNAHKKYFNDFLGEFEYSCEQDLSHIVDPIGKLTTIDGLNFFKYVIVNDYKEKDEDDVKKFECREGVSIFITKEG